MVAKLGARVWVLRFEGNCDHTSHPAGATVYCRVTAGNNEEYMVTSQVVHADGNGWQPEGANWNECYTITSPRGSK